MFCRKLKGMISNIKGWKINARITLFKVTDWCFYVSHCFEMKTISGSLVSWYCSGDDSTKSNEKECRCKPFHYLSWRRKTFGFSCEAEVDDEAPPASVATSGELLFRSCSWAKRCPWRHTPRAAHGGRNSRIKIILTHKGWKSHFHIRVKHLIV